MGIMDFVKGGVRAMMIARDDKKEQGRLQAPGPERSRSGASSPSTRTRLPVLQGRAVRRRRSGPGRHTLQTQNIPFLNNIVNKFTGGDVFIAEIFFVTTEPLYNQGFGGPIGSMRDPELDIRVNPRAFGTYAYKVADPVKFVLEFVGQTGAADPDRAMQWVRDQLMMGLKTTLTRLIKAGDMTMMDLGTAGPDVARAIVQDCPDLAKIGVSVLEIAKLNINLSDEDQARIDEFQDQIVQAKIDARKAKIGVAQAEAQAQQRQYELDQEFANRARYVNQLDMERYQQIRAGRGHAGPRARGWPRAARHGSRRRRRRDGGRNGPGRRHDVRRAHAAIRRAIRRRRASGYPPPGYPPPGIHPRYPPAQLGYPPPAIRRPASRAHRPLLRLAIRLPATAAPGTRRRPIPDPPPAAPGAPPGPPPAAAAGPACGKCGAANAPTGKFCAGVAAAGLVPAA